MKIELNIKYVWAPIALSLIPLILFVFGGESTRILWRENGILETLSALAYLVGFVVGIQGFLKSTGPVRYWLLFWALFCFVCFGEETSWLQHFIGFETPESIGKHNAQGEFNLHNINFLQGGYFLQGGGSLDLKILLKSQNLFRMGFVAFFLLVPIASNLRPISRLFEKLRMPYPGLIFTLAFWIPIVSSIALTFLSQGPTKSALAENREMFYALTIVSFIVGVRLRLKSLAG